MYPCPSCEYCERTYIKPVELQKHAAVKHLADKNCTTGSYVCHHEVCGKSYSYEKNLRQHIITHHEGKKFKCEKDGCGKKFSSAQNLRLHVKRDHSPKPLNNDEISPSSKPSLKRKKRKDAGVPKVSCLAKLSGIMVDGDLNKRLKCRDEGAAQRDTLICLPLVS